MKNIIKNLLNRIDKWTGHSTGKLFFLTFLIHEIFIILIYAEIIPIPSTAKDQLNYHQYAIEISNLLHSHSYIWGAVYGHHWYPLFLGVIYFLFIPSYLLGVSINAILAAFSAVILFKIISYLFRNVNKSLVFWVSFFALNIYSSLVFNTSLLLKESWIILLLLLCIYLSLKLSENKKFKFSIFFVFSLCFLFLRSLRFFIAFGVLVGFFVHWFLNGAMSIKKRIIYGLCMIAFVSILTFIFTGDGVLKSLSVSQFIQPEFINHIRTTYFFDGATTLHNEILTKNLSGEGSGFNFSLTGMFFSFFNVIFGPFPWQVSLSKYLIICTDLFSWYLVLFLAFFVICKEKIKENLIILVPLVIIIIGLTFGVDNVGALLRYRIPVFILLSVFVPFGIINIFNINSKNENTLFNN